MNHPPILETALGLWPDEAACSVSASALARTLDAMACSGGESAVVTLQGDLGAGKTTFTRHLLQALGVQGRIKSPTYAVMEPHEVRLSCGVTWAVSHFDFYRFRDPQEWEDAGFRDVFAAPGLKLCEWPDRAEGLMPAADLQMVIEIEADDRRRVNAQAHSEAGSALIKALAASWVSA